MTALADLHRLAALVGANRSDIARATAEGELPRWLYEHWYLTPAEGFSSEGMVPPYGELGNALNAVADAAGDWDNDWIALSISDDGSCLAGRQSAQRVAQPGRYAGFDRPGLPTVPGERVALPHLLSWIDSASGQWAAQSNTAPDGPRIRLYVNIGADAVGEAVAALTRWLATERIAFSMKCPGTTAGFARADALVLYLAKDEWPKRQAEVIECLEPLLPNLRAGTPALTQALMPGLAFAEDPGNGMSFGEQRCAILAPAIGALMKEEREPVALLVAALEAGGLDPERPWRRPA